METKWFLSMKWANGNKAVWDGLRCMTMKSGYEFLLQAIGGSGCG